MSVTRDYGDVVFECDTCGEIIETHTDDFMDALSFAKGEGWIVSKDGDDWVHFCNRNCFDERND